MTENEEAFSLIDEEVSDPMLRVACKDLVQLPMPATNAETMDRLGIDRLDFTNIVVRLIGAVNRRYPSNYHGQMITAFAKGIELGYRLAEVREEANERSE